jgi:hypothetical protein
LVERKAQRPSSFGYSSGDLDASGNLWLFGGYGVDSTRTGDALNDLWKYSDSRWTWMSGSDVGGQLGAYGIKGVAASRDVAGARIAAVGWTDSSGNLWLFGGSGQDSVKRGLGLLVELNDLWKYEP